MSYAGLVNLAPPGVFDPKYEACRGCSSTPTKRQVREGYRRPIHSLCRPCYSKRGWVMAPELTRGRLLGWKLLRWWYLSVRWLDLGREVRKPSIRDSRKRPPPPAPQRPHPLGLQVEDVGMHARRRARDLFAERTGGIPPAPQRPSGPPGWPALKGVGMTAQEAADALSVLGGKPRRPAPTPAPGAGVNVMKAVAIIPQPPPGLVLK